MKAAISGPRIVLLPPRPSHKDDRRALGRNLEIVRMFGGSTSDLSPLSEAEVDAWYRQIETEPHAWMIEYGRRCIGTARLPKPGHRRT